MILYDRLWDTLAKKGISQYKLIKTYGFSSGQIGRLKKNMHVSTHTLDVLCRLLDCQIQDLVEYIPDDEKPSDSVTELSQLPSADFSGTLYSQEDSAAPSHSPAGTDDTALPEKQTAEDTHSEKSRKSKKEKNKKAKKGKKK